MASFTRALTLGALCSIVVAVPVEERAVATPVFSTATAVGQVDSYPTLDRDSLTSVRLGSRTFWTARDSQSFPGHPFFFIDSSASWSDLNADGSPAVDSIGNLSTFGNNPGPYFPLPSDHCGPSGKCPGSMSGFYKGWPDSPPFPVNGSNGAVKLYTWTRNVHLNQKGNVDNGKPSTSLYRSDYDGSSSKALPKVTLVDENFWDANSTPYGNYGGVLGTDGLAYLYGKSQKGVLVARVDPAKIETGPYSYYSEANGGWSDTAPSFTDAKAPIPNCGTGQQGTFYYSSGFGLYIWIGGQAADDAQFAMTTAPNPWGPWAKTKVFYTGEPGKNFRGYSWQAHPGMSEDLGNGKDIWLTFTRKNHYYETPLIRVQWK